MKNWFSIFFLWFFEFSETFLQNAEIFEKNRFEISSFLKKKRCKMETNSKNTVKPLQNKDNLKNPLQCSHFFEKKQTI